MQRLARPVVPLKEAEHDPGLFPLLQPEGGLGRTLGKQEETGGPDTIRVTFAFGGHPPELGSSVAGPAHVRRDEEIETAAGHIGDLGGAPRTIVEFRAGGAPVDVFGLARAPSFLRAICSTPLVRNSEIRHEHLVPPVPTKMPTKRTAAANFYVWFQCSAKNFLKIRSRANALSYCYH
jgi:hypothetical protein